MLFSKRKGPDFFSKVPKGWHMNYLIIRKKSIIHFSNIAIMKKIYLRLKHSRVKCKGVLRDDKPHI